METGRPTSSLSVNSFPCLSPQLTLGLDFTSETGGLTGIGGHLSRSEFDMLNDAYSVASHAVAKAGMKLESHLKSDLGSEQPLHLSLSRPNVLATGQREGFLELFTDRLNKTRIRPFVPPVIHLRE